MDLVKVRKLNPSVDEPGTRVSKTALNVKSEIFLGEKLCIDRGINKGLIIFKYNFILYRKYSN